jgi:hypothetical protein
MYTEIILSSLVISQYVSTISAIEILYILKDFLRTWCKWSPQQNCAEPMQLFHKVKVTLEGQMSPILCGLYIKINMLWSM